MKRAEYMIINVEANSKKEAREKAYEGDGDAYTSSFLHPPDDWIIRNVELMEDIQ